MKQTKKFSSTVKGDAPIAVIQNHKDIINQFLVGAFAKLLKSSSPITPDNVYWENFSFIQNYNVGAVNFGGHGRFQSYISIALDKCKSTDLSKQYKIEVPSLFAGHDTVKSFEGDVKAFIWAECAIQLSTIIRKYIQSNSVTLFNPAINVRGYTRADFASDDSLAYEEVYRYLYETMLVDLARPSLALASGY
jgi:hypothetical protein